MVELKLILHQKTRFALTVLAIALCAILMLFLLSIYRGVSVGSIAYIRNADADLWIMQKHATNILRSTSLLMTSMGNQIKELPQVESVSPILFIMASAQTADGPATLFLTGFDPDSRHGGPPQVVEGKNISSENHIILDRSFASKYKIKLGDFLPINEDTLEVVGLSIGTNMFVIQYAFIDIIKAYKIIGFKNIATCFQVHLKKDESVASVSSKINAEFPQIAVYDRQTFLDNNIKEMESGLLPLLFVVAFISAVVLSAILSLILTVNVLERRMDYAIMKALGSPLGFIRTMIFKQALIFAFSGLSIGIPLYFLLDGIVEKVSPEVAGETSGWHLIVVILSVTLISLLSSIIPNQRLRNIYPLEVFQ